MAAIINDKALIEEISGNDIKKLIESRIKEKNLTDFNYFPLCNDIIEQLKNLIVKTDSIEYFQLKEVEVLWLGLLDKSIQCLRFFDEREPFRNDTVSDIKIPITYGLDRIKKYLEKYSDFESLLYGSSSYYRDHIFHSLRTWLLGVFCILQKQDDNKNYFIDTIDLDGLGKNDFSNNINFFEKLSIWTITALCHDLGYPLEKSRKILDKTKNMMGEFVPNPSIFDNFNFGGIQDNINDFIIRFLSTKMVSKNTRTSKKAETKSTYFGRIQPKYYLKYSKSLENFDHGIISAIIIYKMLLYFLESDFNMNDDYEYKFEDARQFYIRREILRPMASHTCSDIYNIHLSTFSSLLFICDELQEWGRKSWNELYTGLQPSSINLKVNNFSKKEISVTEEIKIPDVNDKSIVFENIKKIIERQYLVYKMIFRDGQYTDAREFDFHKSIKFEYKPNGTSEKLVEINYELNAKEKNKFTIDCTKYNESESIRQDLIKYLNEKTLLDEVKFLPEEKAEDE